MDAFVSGFLGFIDRMEDSHGDGPPAESISRLTAFAESDWAGHRDTHGCLSVAKFTRTDAVAAAKALQVARTLLRVSQVDCGQLVLAVSLAQNLSPVP